MRVNCYWDEKVYKCRMTKMTQGENNFKLCIQYKKNNTCILTIFQVIARSFAQASSIRSLHNDKVYELRTYSIKPKNFKEFYDLSVEYMHLRTNHSKLVGYWTSEIGGIFDMVHIWEYGNYFLAFEKSSLLMFCTKCIFTCNLNGCSQ